MFKLSATLVSIVAYVMSWVVLACTSGPQQQIVLLLGVGFTILGAGFFGTFVVELTNSVKATMPPSRPVRRPIPTTHAAIR